MVDSDTKRLFFGFEVKAPWPEKFPHGRLLEEKDRHLTLAFLGNVSYSKVEALIDELPKPSSCIGCVGMFNKCLFLPHHKPNCVSWHVNWLDDTKELEAYQKELSGYLFDHDLIAKRDIDRGFLPHVTVSRKPFSYHDWRKAFQKLPMMTSSLHLYESLGQLKYNPIWTYKVLPPFEEIEHTADIAFRVYGKTLAQLSLHAQMALAFEYPDILPYLKPDDELDNLDDIVIALNEIVTRADLKFGVPFKAVSFHGEVIEKENNILMWEMIVDV